MQHLPMPSTDKCKRQNDREGLHFVYKTSCTEKNTQIYTVQSGGSQKKGAGSLLWGTGSVIRGSGSQTRGVGSEIRRDPPQFNPWSQTKLLVSDESLRLWSPREIKRPIVKHWGERETLMCMCESVVVCGFCFYISRSALLSIYWFLLFSKFYTLLHVGGTALRSAKAPVFFLLFLYGRILYVYSGLRK